MTNHSIRLPCILSKDEEDHFLIVLDKNASVNKIQLSTSERMKSVEWNDEKPIDSVHIAFSLNILSLSLAHSLCVFFFVDQLDERLFIIFTFGRFSWGSFLPWPFHRFCASWLHKHQLCVGWLHKQDRSGLARIPKAKETFQRRDEMHSTTKICFMISVAWMGDDGSSQRS